MQTGSSSCGEEGQERLWSGMTFTDGSPCDALNNCPARFSTELPETRRSDLREFWRRVFRLHLRRIDEIITAPCPDAFCVWCYVKYYHLDLSIVISITDVHLRALIQNSLMILITGGRDLIRRRQSCRGILVRTLLNYSPCEECFRRRLNDCSNSFVIEFRRSIAVIHSVLFLLYVCQLRVTEAADMVE